LQFYKLCQRWRTEVDKNPNSLLERMKFEKGPEMSAAVKDVSLRLGFNKTMSIGEYPVTLTLITGVRMQDLLRLQEKYLFQVMLFFYMLLAHLRQLGIVVHSHHGVLHFQKII